MTPLTVAQQIYIYVFGLELPRVLNHSAGKQNAHTKRGPGRKHKQGKSND